MEGYSSIEEQTQDYIGLFLLLQREVAENVRMSFEAAAKSITEREKNTDIFLPSRHLKQCCALTETDYFLVMFAFCCELEGGLCLDFREKYHERCPNLQYAFHLLSAVLPVDFTQIAQFVWEDSRLNDILMPPPEEESGEGLLLRPLLLNRSVFYFLLTGALQEEGWYRLFFSRGDESRKLLPKESELLPLHEREAELLRRYIQAELEYRLEGGCPGGGRPEEQPFRLILHGARGTGKNTLLRRVCRQESVSAVFVNLERMLGEERRRWDQNFRTLRLFGRLAVQLVVLEFGGDHFGTDTDEKRRIELIDRLLTESLRDIPVILLTENAADIRTAERFTKLCLEPAQRLTIEEQNMALEAWLHSDERQSWKLSLLSKYRLNIGEFLEKQRAIQIRAEAEGTSPASLAAWEAGLRERDVRSGLGRLIEGRDASEEIILTEECRTQLETVIKLAKGWTGGQGLHLLFHGSSGTGKTMAASIIAERLRLPLFKVDLSRIFDKYIGETEKHMDEIFHIAQKNHYLLFFDEADALFSKRTGIQDARDKYANVSTSYLLQRIEEYDGMLIMATNLLNHFDDAFVRRVRFVIKFRNLDEKGRELLWEKALTGELPVAENVSFRELSRAAELSPARICAAARVAGILAVCEGSRLITKEYLRRALELEAGKDETAVSGF